MGNWKWEIGRDSFDFPFFIPISHFRFLILKRKLLRKKKSFPILLSHKSMALLLPA